MAIEQKTPQDKIYIDIDGEKGNAFYLLGSAKNLAKQLGMNYHTIMDEMKQGDYMHLLKTFDFHFGDYVTLQTSNPEYLDSFTSMWSYKKNCELWDYKCQQMKHHMTLTQNQNEQIMLVMQEIIVRKILGVGYIGVM